MKNVTAVVMLILFVQPSFSAEKDRGYCGRVIKATDIPSAKSAYAYGNKALNSDLVLAISCDSSPIDPKLSNEELVSKIVGDQMDQEIAFAEVHGNSVRLNRLAKSKQNVCIRARWGSPGPCGYYSTIDAIHTSTDSIYSIVPLERETFEQRFYPEGKDIQ